MKSVQRTVEFIQQHKDALAGSKIALEKARQLADKGGMLGTFTKGLADGAERTVELYEFTLNAFLEEDPVFKDWELAKDKFIAKAKELGVLEPRDTTIDMLATFFE